MKIPDLIMAVFDDYAALKKKGKEGESVLHYDGFINGYELGYKDAVENAARWLAEHYHSAETIGNITCTSVMTEGLLEDDFRKDMGVEHDKKKYND